ncbi:MAG TPA: hypothetical protein VKG79_09375 [Bryobacteraceae bacterium]|nr:hypothetical protein [Bryobacteraceae bacterium]
MQLDTQTLVVVAIVVALVPALIGAMVWQTMRSYPGRWVLGNFMAVLSLILLRLRGSVPDSVSIVLANALAMTAGMAYFQGIRRFRNLRFSWWPESAVVALGVSGLIYFRYATNNINARIVVISFVLGSIGMACGITLLREMPRQRRTAYFLTGAAFTLGGLVHFLRGFYEFIYAPVVTVFDKTPANALFFLLVAAGSLSWSLGFILLTGERLETASERPEIANRADFVLTSRVAEPSEKHSPAAIPEDEIRQQLRRILDSDVFRRSAQMERFLTLVVDRSLLGRREELKEYALGRDVFHRGDDYDPRADSIVRVEAQRLRRKLREYYENQGLADTVLIDLPAGTYVPIFRYTSSNSPRSKKQQSL